MTIVLPTTCKFGPPNHLLVYSNSDIRRLVSEAISLKLRRPNDSHEYLYPQIFSGLSYLLASLCMLEVARILRKRRKPIEVVFRPSGSTLEDATKHEAVGVEKCEK
jgi:hypothetical protein